MVLNSFIVLLDSTIKISKNEKILENKEELNQQEISTVSSFGLSAIFFIIDLSIIIFIKKNIWLIIAFLMLTLLVFLIKHEKLEKWKIFNTNHLIFDALTLLRPLILFWIFKYL
jgi:hypothetical protein